MKLPLSFYSTLSIANFIYLGELKNVCMKTTGFKVIRLKYHIKGSNELRKICNLNGRALESLQI